MAAEELDPSEFVQRIRQLGEQRDQQDAERVRKLEEEIIQGRSERLARRAERARSLSPEKANTPQSQRSNAGTPRSAQEKSLESPTPTMEPTSRQSAVDDSLQRLTGSPAPTEGDEPKKPTPSAAVGPSRAGTLSWQRRPQSGTRRPLSMASADKSAAQSPRETPEPTSPADSTMSRNQIAQSLEAKDPTWFRQTPDRGIGSAAYRRNQHDNASEAGSIPGKRQLPGMSRESTAEPEVSSPPPESVRSSSPSRAGSVRGSAAPSSRFSTNTSISGGDSESIGKRGSPMPLLESQKLNPPSDQASSTDGGEQLSLGRSLAMSPSQGRISPERPDRPSSPTKGMGGFVQSAMLKRSDSVNKRWSTQPPTGLARADSTASNRSSVYGGYGGSSTVPKLERPSSLSRDNSLEPSSRPTSRPTSSSSNLTITKDAAEKDNTPKGEFVKPALPFHSRGKSVTVASATTFSEDKSVDETSPPSPSKRWSPTKSSWLESALNKPDSPKIKLPPPQQPAWMAEINRIKQQRASVDLGKGATISSPPGVSPQPSPSLEATAAAAKEPKDTPKKETLADMVEKKEPEPVELERKAKPAVLSPKPDNIVKSQPHTSDDSPNRDDVENTTSEMAKPKPVGMSSRFPKESPLTKSKPDIPSKTDFRAGLKSRQVGDKGPRKEELEFQNVFGKLKKTQTQNFVPPDELKSNILRGKAGLTLTGGPKPSVRRDELKESLLAKKEEMKAKAQEAGPADPKRSSNPAPTPSTPEAVARRKNLSRTESITSPPPATKEKNATPEALKRKQSLRETAKPSIPEKMTQPAPSFTVKEAPKSSKLADRFNPALAGILARGPSPMSSNGASSKSDNPADGSSNTARPSESRPSGPAPELTHMTKGRARGPKRRAPKQDASAATPKDPLEAAPVSAIRLVRKVDVLPSNAPPAEISKPSGPAETVVTRTPARDSLQAKSPAPVKSPDLSRKLEKSPSPELARKPPSAELGRQISSPLVEKHQETPTEPLAETPPKPASPTPRIASWKAGARPLPTPPVTSAAKEPKPSSPIKEKALVKKETAREDESSARSELPSVSVKNATALWGRQSASSSPASTRTRSPIKLPTRADEQASMENAGLVRSPEPAHSDVPAPLTPKPKPVGLGLGSLGSAIAAKVTRGSTPPQPASSRYPASPPLSGGRPQSEPFGKSPVKSNDPFADFFDEPPATTGALPDYINTEEVLTSSPIDVGPSAKIRTLRKQIHEISPEGKLTPLPMQEEHVLFEDTMYLCTHVFGNAQGAKTTEVYLWAGNGVADATLEDVQLFGRNAAKQNSGKLIIVRQGKETPNMFEALGGIVITRRGAPPASNRYMLCGRRHMGHIAFDEVDLSLKSLCSGFPYLVSSDNGTVFLWKGRGCSAEELAAARLMGMDLCTSAELVELDEGSESPRFFETFPSSDTSSAKSAGKQSAAASIPRSADHWRHKATSEKYRARLFKFEQQQGQSGWGQGLQVSNFLAPLLRRPSWQSFYSSSSPERPTSRPQTPQTPKTPNAMTTKITEIMPFSQRDLEPESIYVLDAFFEMYIIVGSLSRSQSVAFGNALLFAQEYSILAVSADDRPFVPVTTVVLEGVPKDMKAVFRHWDDRLVPTASLMSGKLGRGKSLRIVGLDKAIEATRR